MTINNLKELQNEFKHRAKDYGLHVQVPGDGNFNAKYAIIGEGPGQAELNEGRSFVGYAGRMLWDGLRPHRLLRTDFYITNVVKRQISLAKNTKHPINADEWLKWQSLTQWELDQLPNLEYILCLGNAGLSTLFGWEGVNKYRGSVYDYKGKRTLISLNPAAVLREPKDEIVFRLDMARFGNVIRGDHHEHEVRAIINPTFTEAVAYIDKMIADQKPVSYDIETISNETACHGIGNDPHEAMCINLRTRYENHYTLEEEAILLNKLQEMFDKCEIVAQNGNFDAHWVGYKDHLDLKIAHDTMLMHHTLYPTLPHNLGFITSQYTTHPYYKDEISSYREGGDIDDFWRYNCKDVAITLAAFYKLREELKQQKLHDFYYNHVQRLDKYLVQTTVDGLLTDPVVKGEVAAKIKADIEKISIDLIEMAREELKLPDAYNPNLNSGPQMKDLFLNKLNLKSASGSFDATARQKILNDNRTSMAAQQMVLKYNEYQKAAKFHSTYAESRVDPDDRIRYTFKQQGVAAAPGRLSSSGTLWGTGLNMQNQPKAAYKFYIADPGTVMFYFDLSQAEARVVAYLADIEKWKEDFERARLGGDFDAHRSLAASMYSIPYNEVPTEDVDEAGNFTIRYKAKRCRHGLNYTMQWPRLAETTNMSPYEAKRSFILYHKVNPEIELWWKELERIVRKEKELWTPLGRRLRILQRIDDDSLGNIVAFVPQSTIGDHAKRVWYQCHEDDEWDNRKMRIKLNVHDALIGIATPDKVKDALRIAKRYAEQPILIQDVYRRKVEPLIIPADTAISEPDEFGLHRWSTLKKVKDLASYEVKI